MTINDFAKVIIKVSGANSEIVYKPLPVDDPKVRQPDISLAKRILNWEPTVELEGGLALTMEYLKKKVSKTT